MNHKLLKKFPAFAKPSYETVAHKKVSDDYDLQVAIPYGKRAFLWFTAFETQHICCIVEISRTQTLQDNIHILPIAFPHEFALGTLLSGYLTDSDIEESEQKYFFADDIFLFKGYTFGDPFPIPMAQKHDAFRSFFTELPQKRCTSYSIHTVSMQARDRDIGLVAAYPVKCMQYRVTHNVAPHVNWTATKNAWNMPLQLEEEDTNAKPSIWTKQLTSIPNYTLQLHSPAYKGKKLFWVEADLAYDVYRLYAQQREVYQYAFIPDMKTSYFMNGLFRKIPENVSLDRVEESDSEEEFENMDERKYMQNTNPILMECIFHRKFKKWVPLAVKPSRLGKYVPYLADLIVQGQVTKKNVHIRHNGRRS